MRIFLQAIFGQIFLNAYIFWRGYRMLPPKRIGRWLFISFFVVELFFYFFGFIFHNSLSDIILSPIMWICNTWFIASIYFALGLLIIDLCKITIKKTGRGHASFHLFPRFPLFQSLIVNAQLFILFVVVAVLMVNGYYNAMNPVVRHLEMHIPKPVEGRDSLTIVLMSDLHISESIGKKQVQRFIGLCNDAHPDLVLIGGDIVDYDLRRAEKEHIEEDLRRINAPLGVYMILGNHEYRANRFAKIRWLGKTGGILLVDTVVMPDGAFSLIGRDDVVNKNRASLETLMHGVDQSKPVIVLEHQPMNVRELISNRCDLGLYGHTHNGQWWPFSMFLKLFFKYSYGYYSQGDSKIYVSSGVGFAGPPFRIGTRSEIVVIRLRFNN